MPAHSRTGLATTALSFRVNEVERAQIQRNAADAALSVGEYVRSCTLHRVIKHRADVKALAELKSFGGLLKHLHNEGIGHDAKTAEILNQISNVLKKVAGDQ
jgi:hypothetical protein